MSKMSSGTNIFTQSWMRVVALSIAVSVCIQALSILAQRIVVSQYLICNLQFAPEFIKQAGYCSAHFPRKRYIGTTELGYFVDPLSVEPWYFRDDFKEVEKAMAPTIQENAVQWGWETEKEAFAALKAAVQSRTQGNMAKAELIIQHALALAPHHPDILTEYGLVVEMGRKNVVEAEELYSRALSYNPHHPEALIRRARTLPIVEEIDKEMLKKLHEKRSYFSRIPKTNTALRKAMKESYFLHIYHTVALEGNTMSLGQTRSILETRMAVAGKSIMEHNEILGMDSALRFINQSVAHISYFTLQDILDIHSRVLGFVDPEAAGVFRKTQVFVGSFTPISANMVAGEMEEMVKWLNEDESLLLDPIERAAIAHYKLVSIHPFIDGNGRTARLVMNLILMQSGFPPVIIPVEARADYYDTLNAANRGNLRPFIRFIARQTDATLQLYINSVTTCDYREGSDECSISTAPEISTQQAGSW
ncbi:fic protein family protein [Loa loa]|uniref:protein adenylyltransferase n=2 Tax=Loa loa TaxID=7209 RepID=A0A1S0TWA6_LOALO|nr:fic protein family protein [Loa loa]EFO21377.2 fic protein family protein [Loa loa]